MAFYRPDSAMASQLERVLDQLDSEERPGLRNSLSITWVRYGDDAPEAGQQLAAGALSQIALRSAEMVSDACFACAW